MRVHLLALPNTPTTASYQLDGFAQATRRVAQVLQMLGATVTLYGASETDAPCAEFVSCVTEQERQDLLGTCAYQDVSITETHPLWTLANPRMIRAIAQRKQPRDFLCIIGGISQQSVAAAHPDLMCVEYSIGYVGSFAPYRVFQSVAWRHSTYGFQHLEDGRFFDTVIPAFFDPAEFPFNPNPEPFVLYVGRLTERKGIGIACDAARAAGVPLKVIGHGDPGLITYGDYLGALQTRERNLWMSRAHAVLTPTQYIEPFGNVAAEAQLCGTPVISTDWGGFTETVQHGITGFRCSYLGEFVEAIEQVKTLNRQAIRWRAERLYSLDAVAQLYRSYFDRLSLLWEAGWATIPRMTVPA